MSIEQQIHVQGHALLRVLLHPDDFAEMTEALPRGLGNRGLVRIALVCVKGPVDVEADQRVERGRMVLATTTLSLSISVERASSPPPEG